MYLFPLRNRRDESNQIEHDVEIKQRRQNSGRRSRKNQMLQIKAGIHHTVYKKAGIYQNTGKGNNCLLYTS